MQLRRFLNMAMIAEGRRARMKRNFDSKFVEDAISTWRELAPTSPDGARLLHLADELEAIPLRRPIDYEPKQKRLKCAHS